MSTTVGGMDGSGELHAGTGAVGERATALFWIAVFLVPLLLTAARSLPEVEPLWPAVAGLVGFISAYVATLWSGLCWPGRPGSPSRLRLAGLAVVTTLGVALAAGYPDGPDWTVTLLYVGIAGVAVVPVLRFAIGWLVGTVAVLAAIAAASGGPVDQVTSTGLSIVLAGVAVLMLMRTIELVERLRRTRAELAEAAVTAERLRFSRDLHDLLGHTLSLIVVKAELAKRSASRDPRVAQREAGEIEQIGRRALAEVREVVSGYGQRTFATELAAARTALAGAGMDVTVRANGAPLPAPADSLFGWVVREAATNVVRHSDARHCRIEVRRGDGNATLEVRDDGSGAATGPDGTGRGLLGLAERVAGVGGHLEAGEPAGGGWRVTATVPVS